MGAAEWARIEAGLIQRLMALNAFIDDLYHTGGSSPTASSQKTSSQARSSTSTLALALHRPTESGPTSAARTWSGTGWPSEWASISSKAATCSSTRTTASMYERSKASSASMSFAGASTIRFSIQHEDHAFSNGQTDTIRHTAILGVGPTILGSAARTVNQPKAKQAWDTRKLF